MLLSFLMPNRLRALGQSVDHDIEGGRLDAGLQSIRGNPALAQREVVREDLDAGLRANIGERLQAAGKYLPKEEVFLANYSDGLTNLHFPTYIDFARQRNKIATFISVRPNVSYHFVKADAHGLVTDIEDVRQSGVRINGGFFVLSPRVIDYIDGDDTVFERAPLGADAEWTEASDRTCRTFTGAGNGPEAAHEFPDPALFVRYG